MDVIFSYNSIITLTIIILIILLIIYLSFFCVHSDQSNQNSDMHKNYSETNSSIQISQNNQNNQNNQNSQADQLDKLFYTVDETNVTLKKIDPIKYKILNETRKIYDGFWNDWPEKELYGNKQGQWKIFPFFAFGLWVKKNCMRCPNIYKFLKKIKGLKVAILSKLSPGMLLNSHRGWGNHSNHVIRCHYGLIIPDGNKSYISVSKEKGINEITQYHKQFEWTIFDDSKWHYAVNNSDSDRIVLIIDVERPPNIKLGTSDVKDTKELLEIVNYFKNEEII